MCEGEKLMRVKSMRAKFVTACVAASVVAAALGASAPVLAQDSQEPAPQSSDSGEIVVPGRVDVPAPTPPGDPRSTAQRMRDIRAWDRCLVRAQAASDTDPTRYQPDTPEQMCRDSLGMANRTAIPVSRD